jgi:YfiH family protein
MTEPFKKSIDGLYRIERWEKESPGLTAGFTSKDEGSGIFNGLNMAFHVNDDPAAVQQNRICIGEKTGIPAGQWIGCEQTHGMHIEHVSKEDSGRGALDYDSALSSTDGLYTKDPGVLLTLCYADCVPLYFYDRSSKQIGAAHAGWKGSVGGIGPAMIEKWKEAGSQLKDIEVVIGPSICGDCYKVGKMVANKADKWYSLHEIKSFLPVSDEPDTFYFSLQNFNRDLLLKAGVPKENIHMTRLCTNCSSDFFSYRRDKGHTGRMMSYIGWKE